jgi:uncharacterized protein
LIPHTNRRKAYEILAVLLTASGKFLFMDFLNWKLLFIVLAIVGWASYLFIMSRKSTGILFDWGFRSDNFKEVTRMVLPFAVGFIIALVAIGSLRGTINLTWHIFPILLLYPVWGTIQQFLLIALVT